MTQTIYKYELRVDDEQFVDMPTGAKMMCVQMQHGKPCLWALVDPILEKERRTVIMCGTGHPMPYAGRYISTFQMDGGALVFHAFER